jgi:hypothetical protein
MRVNREETLGWALAMAVVVALLIGMRSGWSPHRGYRFGRGWLLTIPIIVKGIHSVSDRLRQWR